ncbi:ABC transporter substrate-binding protein [Streptomyces sp. CL12-4]|uniref:ABC transporter substrate-binding protein n=1 Tax=Streptomyces sp. CL12-4 TaxID=2810306 RepID=UPI001EFAC2DA|nr:extracellular solute-binding protein [Streptomyces sp. CL12-4]MCG8971537.1 extracellular solute-binding protein [Streptomyces sp. CL12-4]
MANATDKVAMGSVVTAFKRQHPDIEVSVTYADTGDLQRQLPAQLRAGEGPDIFTVWPGSGNPASVASLEDEGLLEDLSLRRFNRTMPMGVKPVTDVDGSTYAVPVTFSAIGAIYSTKTLATVGGTIPETWTELLDLCDTAREHGTVLFALGNKTPWVTQLVSYALVATTVYAPHPDFDDDMDLGKETFASSGWRTALGKYLEMRDRGCFNDDPLETTYEQALDRVTSGRAVGVIQIGSALSALRADSPDLSLKMAALPATDHPDDTRMPGAVSAAYGLNPESPHREAAIAFINFLGSAEGQNLYNRTGATLPAIPNTSFTVDSAVKEVAERQKSGTTVPFMDQRWPNSAVQSTHFEQVRALFAGTASVDDALNALDRAYQYGD